MTREEWAPATVQYNDWVGTAAMDDPPDPAKLREFARLDDDWAIVAIEFYGGSEATVGRGSDRGSMAWVLAMRREVWRELGGADGIRRGQELDVTRFPVRESDALGLLQAMKRWSVRVSARGVAEAELVVAEEHR